MKNSAIRLTLAASVAGSWPVLAFPALAQQVESWDDIVVTARRREERLLDVPVSVAVLESAQLTQYAVTDSRDLAKVTPNLQVARAAAGGHTNFYTMRGIGGSETMFGQDQTVGIYFDEVPNSRQEGTDLQTFDLGNVQVLYGPQGTLFGRNTTAGAIVYSTARPTDRFEGSAEIQIGNFDARWFTGMLNVPITEGLAVRFAGQIKRRDGWVREVVSGKDLNNQRSESWRGSLRWRTGAVTNDLIVSGFHASERNTADSIYGYKAVNAPTTCTPPSFEQIMAAPPAQLAALITPVASNPACRYGPGAPGIPLLTALGLITPAQAAAYAQYPTVAEALEQNSAAGKNGVAYYGPGFARDKAFSITDILTADVSDRLTLKAVGGYRFVQTRIQAFAGAYALPAFNSTQVGRSRQYSIEGQAQYASADDALNVTAGIFHFQEKGFQYNGPQAYAAQPLAEPYILALGNATNRSTSLYAQASYNLPFFPRLGLTAGYRYNWDYRRTTLKSGNYLIDANANVGDLLSCTLLSGTTPLPVNACQVNNSARFKVPTYMVSVDFKPIDEVMVYGTYSRGYRSGGFNIRSISVPQAFGPERVNNYEAGLKSDFRLGDVGVRFNATYWRMDYNDIQTVVIFVVPGTTTITSDVQNRDDLKLRGFEAELAIEPVRGVTLRGFLGRTTGKYPAYPFQGQIFTDLPYPTSKYSGGVSASIEQGLGGNLGRLTLSGNYSFRSNVLVNNNPLIPYTMPSFDNASLRLEWSEIAGSGASVAAFGRNLVNSRRQFVTPNLNLITQAQHARLTEPSFYGVELGWKF